MKPVWKPLLVTVAAGALAACSSGSGDDGTGRISVAVTDAPVDDATRVMVEFTGVELQPQDGERVVIDFEQPRQIDLLALTGANSDALIDDEVPAGPYNFMLLKVNAARQTMDSFIEFENGSFSLFVPSGAQQGLRLVSGFTVAAGGRTDFTVDFDLRKSIHRPQGPPGEGNDDFFLRPALRLVDNAEVGHLAGTVLEEIAGAETCSPAVYVYDGHDATPGDVCTDCENGEAENGDEVVDRPLTTTLVQFDDQDMVWEYEVGFLLAGPYTAALTCDSAADDPETDDTLVFVDQRNVDIVAGETAIMDFDTLPDDDEDEDE
jgi:hypothetical protein